MRDFNRYLAQANACEDAVQQAKMYEQLAKQGCAEAQYRLAVCYYEGHGVQEDRAVSIGWLRQAVAAGDEDAPSFLGGLLLHSDDAGEAAEGERLCLDLAEHGDIVACMNLGNHYYYADRDEEAARLFRRAADENFAPAMSRLGECYLHGYGVQQNHHAAYSLFRKAAEQGYIPACYYTALCCYKGVGTQEDRAEGNRLLQTAVEAEHLPALEMYGAILLDAPETADEGVRYLTRAAEGGRSNAMFVLYSYLQDHGEEEKAELWLRRAAEEGHREAQCDLGHTLMQEGRSPQEEEEALSWLQQSAEQGDTLAEHNLGIYYENHPDLPDAEALSFRHFKEAAARDYLPAIYRLSRCYFEGRGVCKNRATARRMLQYAADSGYVSAAYTLGSKLLEGEGLPKDEAEGLRYLRMAAKGGNGYAAYRLGLCYRDGQAVAADRNRYLRYMKQAVQLGDADAVFQLANVQFHRENYTDTYDLMRLLADTGYPAALSFLAFLLKHGTGCEKDTEAALRLYRKGAQAGDADCLAGYAELTEQTGDDDRTQQKAFRLWQRAAEAGNERAETELAFRYDVGKGVRKNNKKANELYLAVLEKREDMTAAFNLAYNYYYGIGTEEDEARAAHYFEIAYRMGSTYAPLYLGRCCLHGQGAERDVRKAVQYLREAAEDDIAEAMEELGYLYDSGMDSLAADPKAAARWWRKGAELGHAQCCFEYGNCFKDGNGVRRDFRKALEWWLKGAEKNHVGCLCNVGCCYSHGDGVAQDYAEAVAYFRRCLELEPDAIAAYNLARRYYHGTGVEQNDAEAFRYFRLSAENGFAESRAMMGYLYEKGRGVEQNDRMAVDCYRQALNAGFTDAAYRLGRCYENGIGVRKNLTRARDFYRQAADKGDKDAVRALKRLNKQE